MTVSSFESDVVERKPFETIALFRDVYIFIFPLVVVRANATALFPSPLLMDSVGKKRKKKMVFGLFATLKKLLAASAECIDCCYNTPVQLALNI